MRKGLCYYKNRSVVDEKLKSVSVQNIIHDDVVEEYDDITVALYLHYSIKREVVVLREKDEDKMVFLGHK
jgi:hypothetical protein